MKGRAGRRQLKALGLTLAGLLLMAPLIFSPAASTAAGVQQQRGMKDEDAAHEQGPRGKITFASDLEGNFEIYLLNPTGGGLLKVTDNRAEDFDPSFSPDGERIAFVSDRGGNQNIFAIGDNGGGEAQLTSDAADDLDPAWSPGGTKIAFTSERDGNQNIYVMDADGSNQLRLTDSAADDFRPTWSPDGTKIAFTTTRDGNDEIYVMNADGGAQTNVSNNAADDLNPAWSPMRITFQSTRDGNDEIYSMNASGGAQTRLTDDPAFDGRPARSMDGSRVVFVSDRDGSLDIYVMNADGSAPARLTASEESDLDPDVQPLTTVSPGGTIQFGATAFTVSEGASRVEVTVTRAGNTSVAAVVDFATVSGTASDRSDFSPAFGTLEFAAGETSKTIIVPLIDDAFTETDETFTLTLANPTNVELGGPNSTVVTVTDNDATPPASNPIDAAPFFVRQQYLDFLGREPDAPGLTFWTNQLNALIARCPASPANSRAACVLDARATVSTSFFVSIEFQETGYFLIRVYEEAFDRLPTIREFLADLQEVKRGVVIGQPGAFELLAARKRAFIDRFIDRDEFRSRYAAVSNTAYVNALFTNAGVEPGTEAATRDALINGLNNGTETRATALAVVGNTPTVFNALYNPAFVLMEYIGYLRRDPDPAGFQFWLNKLNSASLPGEDARDANVALARIKRAQLVEAFIDSVEYRTRFGPDNRTVAESRTAFAVTADSLVRIKGLSPGSAGVEGAATPITGLQPGETVLGIDFRPATGQLYALGSTGRLYIVNTSNAQATLASTLVAIASDETNPFTALNGASFGVDFNPTVDRLRVVSDAEQNLRINVTTGETTTDGAIAYAAGDPNASANPSAVGAAYTNNFAGSTATTLFDIDTGLDVLTRQVPPNDGTQNTVGTLGVDVTGGAGFDIDPANGIAYALLTTGSGTPVFGLYTINLTTGAATPLGTFTLGNPGTELRGFAIAPASTP